MISPASIALTPAKAREVSLESESAYWSVIVHYEKEEQKKSERLERKSYEDLLPNDKQVYGYLNQWRTEKSEQLNQKKFMIMMV